MTRNAIYLLAVFILLCLMRSVPLQAQQVTATGGGILSQGGISCTVSMGEVFVLNRLPVPGAPVLSTGTVQPATGEEIEAAQSTDGSAAFGAESRTSIRAYYDPRTQTAVIRFAPSAGTPRNARVYGMSGALKQTFTPPADGATESIIPFRGMSPGVYLLQVSAGNDLLTIKISKQ
jgi:septal ring-binding cell division protein DamX